jgi:organic hydroperoxide reductase OsmC/OhrA
MHPLPHHYPVSASATAESIVVVEAPGVHSIETAGPVEFGGPGDKWSPESLLTAAVANCFVLSFRAIARAARFEWSGLRCEVGGTLDRVDGVTRFTAFAVHARLTIVAGTDEAKAHKLLHKAERACLITNSLKSENSLTTEIDFG